MKGRPSMNAPIQLLSDEEVRSLTGNTERGFGCLSTEQGQLPLKALDVDARVIGTYAYTTVRQAFVNSFGVPLEATYIFPLPDRAAVQKFTMTVAGRSVDGVLQERGQARATYDRAIAQGKRASIAEEERSGVFTIRVGNILPGEMATITLELTAALPVADGEVTYRFPLVVAPRYMPGQELSGASVGDGVAQDTNAVPDASRISPPVLLPGFPNPVRLSIGVELDPAGLPLSNVRSSLHAATADDRGGRLVVQTTAGERLNRDFILRFRLGDSTMRQSVRALRAPDGTATLALTLVPPVGAPSSQRPKNVVFVLDRSGSMGGWKMVAARRACARMIDALRVQDRFQVLAFDDVVEEAPFGAGLMEATDRNRFQTVEWLSKVDARNGTEMAPALGRAADLLGGGYLESDRVLVFITDGQVGNEAQLMKLLGQRLKGARVFALGIDQAVNAAFLNKLAALGRSGDAELIESEERLDEALTRAHRRVESPLLAELTLELEGGTLLRDSIAPQLLPDVFEGVPVTVFARASGLTANATVVVRGRQTDGQTSTMRVGVDEVRNPAVGAAWARMHLRDLEDRFDIGREDKAALERKIVAVSLEHSVMCRFTAFVAVDHETVNQGGALHRMTQAVEQPQGWDSMGGGGALGGQKMRGGAVAKASMASAGRAGPAPAPTGGAPRQMAVADRADMELDDDASFDAGAPLEEMMAPEPMAAPPPPARMKRAEAVQGAPSPVMKPGAMLDRAKDAVVDLLQKSKKEDRKQQVVMDLASFRPRLVELVEFIRAGAGDVMALAREVHRKVALLLEDMAHARLARTQVETLEKANKTLGEAIQHGNPAATQAALTAVEGLLEVAAGGVARSNTGRQGFWR
jgi:Ca-activated chloride channel family protein